MKSSTLKPTLINEVLKSQRTTKQENNRFHHVQDQQESINFTKDVVLVFPNFRCSIGQACYEHNLSAR